MSMSTHLMWLQDSSGERVLVQACLCTCTPSSAQPSRTSASVCACVAGAVAGAVAGPGAVAGCGAGAGPGAVAGAWVVSGPSGLCVECLDNPGFFRGGLPLCVMCLPGALALAARGGGTLVPLPAAAPPPEGFLCPVVLGVDWASCACAVCARGSDRSAPPGVPRVCVCGCVCV